MANSFQNEVPRARVNITLNLDNAGARRRTELPLKMLVMGDYSRGRAEGRLRERERVAVSRDNLESVLAELAPRLRLSAPDTLADDGSEVEVDLTFESFSAFHPEQVARRIPQVNNMLAMRNLLKDLKSNLLDHGRLRRELETILADESRSRQLMHEMRALAPLQEAEAPAESETSAAE